MDDEREFDEEAYEWFAEKKAEEDMDEMLLRLPDYIVSATKQVAEKVNAYIQARDELADLIKEAEEVKKMADEASVSWNRENAEEFKKDYDELMEIISNEFSDDDLSGSLDALEEMGYKYHFSL